MNEKAAPSGAHSRALSFGPVCTPELHAVGIQSDEQIRELGWEECLLRWVELFPTRMNVNAALGLIAAEQGVDWRNVSELDRGRARSLVARLRQRSALSS